MGKRKQASTYVHKDNPNPRAHESDDRKITMAHNLDMKRHEKCVTRLREQLMNYLSDEDKERANIPLDPEYCLKGAARAAQAYYLPPNHQEAATPVNLFDTYRGRLYDHVVGKEYILALRDYGLCVHNHCKKTKAAAKLFQDIIGFDPEDQLKTHARDHLLRCYMASAWGDKAREVIETYPQHRSSCFLYNRVILDMISYELQEPGSSQQVIQETLRQGKVLACTIQT
jgi:hypothetical protein